MMLGTIYKHSRQQEESSHRLFVRWSLVKLVLLPIVVFIVD
jgi:hypothetical protein